MNTTTDIICVGEVLIDFIGHEIGQLSNTKDFHRFLGGSPTNVAVNAARLGLNVALVATCGNDGLGNYIVEKLNYNNVNTKYLEKSLISPTSVIFISRSLNTPDFIPYREADCQIYESQIPDELLQNSKIFHTTCFALSKNPSRNTIINRAQKAKSLGVQISLDLNYSEKIWNDRKEAQSVIETFLANNPLLKISDDDCLRYFGEEKSDENIFNYFHDFGVSTICLTKGKDGVKLSDQKDGLFFQEAHLLSNIKDTTGAGDAFWTGFLFAKLHKKTLNECITIAQKLASIKLAIR